MTRHRCVVCKVTRGRMVSTADPCEHCGGLASVPEDSPLLEYHFSAAGDNRALGYTAGVWAYSPREAAAVLTKHFANQNQEIVTFDKCPDHTQAPHVHWVNAWNNERPVSTAEIDDVADLAGAIL